MRDRLAAALAAVGNIVGLRSTESDVIFTVEGRWSGKFDPIRLSLSLMVAGMAVLIGICSVLNLDTEEVFAPTRDPTPTPE